MEKRKKTLEKHLIDQFQKLPNDQNTYMINNTWVQQWKEYLYNQNKYFKKTFLRGKKAPGKITNNELLINNQVRKGLVNQKDYRYVNKK